MKKTIGLLVFAAAVTFGVGAQNPKADFKANILKSGSNYYAYPYTDAPAPKLTAAPKGYKPFYIDHYGRHGSRWLIDRKQYSQPVDELAKGERNGKLTARGAQVLAQLRDILAGSKDRLGELTDVGAAQHRGIGRRMYKNFPEVFAGNAHITARSSVVIRCILSMSNELQELYALNPRLQISEDASYADMYYCAHSDSVITKLRKKNNADLEAFLKSLVHPENLCKKLFTDQKFVADSINAEKMMTNLWDVCSNQQSHTTKVSFYDLFSADEVYQLWQRVNAYWYVHGGYTRYTDYRAPYSQFDLLRDMLLTADKAVEKGVNTADLRFGHESCLLPLACLMELNNVGERDIPFEKLGERWQNYNIFPMGCNIQWVFYQKPGSKDVLVKVLLNEAEAKLPVKTDMAPYYHWQDVREYYWKKLNDYAAKHPDSDFKKN